MESFASLPNSRGNLSPLRVSGASTHEAMKNAAPTAPLINLASSDDCSVDAEDHFASTADSTNQSLQLRPRVPKLPPLPFPPDASESTSPGDSSDDDYVPPAKSPDSATTSPKKLSSFKSPAKHSALAPAPHSDGTRP